MMYKEQNVLTTYFKRFLCIPQIVGCHYAKGNQYFTYDDESQQVNTEAYDNSF